MKIYNYASQNASLCELFFGALIIHLKLIKKEHSRRPILSQCRSLYQLPILFFLKNDFFNKYDVIITKTKMKYQIRHYYFA